jgi:polyhydroxybutyrate depolymerase
MHVPPGYSGTDPVPLVLGFPAPGMSAEVFAAMTRLPSMSDAAGFLFVVVVADDGSWSPGDGAAGTDIAYVRELLDALDTRHCLDSSRVFVAGYSSGGSMAQALACAMPERIAALAVVASLYQPCRADVPMIAFHGIADSVAPFDGGVAPPPASQAVSFPSVRRAVSEWARALGCDGLATISRLSSDVELSTYRRCLRGDGEALLYSIVGGGHTWPGSPANIDALGFTTQQIDASETIWQFFQDHSKGR